MAQSHPKQFVHRLNNDGTIDSICCDCFITAATATSKSALEREERMHKCDAWLIVQYKNFRHYGISSQCVLCRCRGIFRSSKERASSPE
jgi:hypothetical protein